MKKNIFIIMTIFLLFIVANIFSLEEIVSKRTFFTKTYHVEGNKYRKTFSAKPIHYKNEEGLFDDIPENPKLKEQFLNLAYDQLRNRDSEILDIIREKTVMLVDENNYYTDFNTPQEMLVGTAKETYHDNYYYSAGLIEYDIFGEAPSCNEPNTISYDAWTLYFSVTHDEDLCSWMRDVTDSEFSNGYTDEDVSGINIYAFTNSNENNDIYTGFSPSWYDLRNENNKVRLRCYFDTEPDIIELSGTHFTNLCNGLNDPNYTANFAFSKSSYDLFLSSNYYDYVEIGSDLCLDYTINNRYYISGRIIDDLEQPVSNVRIEYTGSNSGLVYTDTNGEYSFIVDQGWSGAITPSIDGYFFNPNSCQLTNIQSNTTQDFSAIPSAVDITQTMNLNGPNSPYSPYGTKVKFEKIGGGSFQIILNENNCNDNGTFTFSVDEEDYGYYNITFINGDFYPKTLSNKRVGNNWSSWNINLSKIGEHIVVSSSPSIYFRNIENAAKWAVDYHYEDIDILPGTYSGQINIPTPDNGYSLTISGVGNNPPVISGSGGSWGLRYSGVCSENLEAVTIENLKIENFKIGIDIEGGMPIITNNIITNCETGIRCIYGATISDNTIENNINVWQYADITTGSGGGIYIDNQICSSGYEESVYVIDNQILNNKAGQGAGIFCTGSYEVIIEGNTFSGNQLIEDGTGALPGHGTVIYLENSENVTIKNNIISNNLSDGNTHRYGIQIHESSRNIDIINNTIIDNADLYAIYAVSTSYYSNYKIYNNIMMGNFSGISVYDNHWDRYIEIRNCIATNNIANNFDFEDCSNSNLYQFDPKLNPTTYTPLWHNSDKSPAIDAGYTTEFDPDGTPKDIGAIRVQDHKYDVWTLEGETARQPITWISFPALDRIYGQGTTVGGIFGDIFNDEILKKLYFRSGFYEWTTNGWNDNGCSYKSTTGYKVELLNVPTQQVKISGIVENPDAEIILDDHQLGNWIGYFLEDSQDPLDAFASIIDDIYMIKTQSWAMRKDAAGGWMGSGYRYTLNYGDMIIVYLYSGTPDIAFSYQDDAPVPPKTKAMTTNIIYQEKADYVPIFIDPKTAERSLPQEIGLYVNGECKGAVVVDDTSMVQMNAYVLDGNNRGSADVEFLFYYGRNKQEKIKDYYVMDNENGNFVEKSIDLSDGSDYYNISFDKKEGIVPIPSKLKLSNYPNPFSNKNGTRGPVTTFKFSLPQDSNVELDVFNLKGQVVKTVLSEKRNAGYHEIGWNGKDEAGKECSSGVYFYRLKTDQKTINNKMLLMK